MRVYPSRLGDKVHVTGEPQSLGRRVSFDFRTMGEVKYRGKTKSRMGFADGDAILKHILKKSVLKITEHSGPGYYYARE